jgi:hypothetical protein
MDPELLSGLVSRPQESGQRLQRRCLLKGCEQWFRPTHPLCRYCSGSCRAAARRWRHWRAQQKYRASRHGRELRQRQAQRYRQRFRNRPPPTPQPPPDTSAPIATSLAAAVPTGGAASCEGKRLLEKSVAGPGCPCDRPGCYVLFAPGSAGKPRRFCCVLCRRALRCVLQREARSRRRRRRGLRRPGRRPRRRTRGP